MSCLRRSLALAAVTGMLAFGPATAALGSDAPGASDTSTVGIDPPDAPVVGCGFQAPTPDQGIAVGEPAPDGSGTAGESRPADGETKPDPGGEPDPDAPVDPAAEELAASSDGSVSPDEFCIAAMQPGAPAAPVDEFASGGGEGAPVAAPVAAPAQLPRTGPAPVLPSLGLGFGLLALGAAALATARRRTVNRLT